MKTNQPFLLCLFALFALSVSAQTWKPAPVTLTSEWGAQVTPDNAWREYPRPQLVRERWQNLNGLWDYTITAQRATARSREMNSMLNGDK